MSEYKTIQVTKFSCEDQLIIGLFQSLPEFVGEEWALKDRDKWLKTASSIFSLLYQNSSEDDL